MAVVKCFMAFSRLHVLFWLLYFQVSCSRLNLYIAKENLKSDLNLDFGNDIYIVNDGKHAPLLSNPDAFRGLVAPLQPSINKVEFRWMSFPDAKDISYSMSLWSSNIEIMDTPTTSVPTTAFVPWYDQSDTGFKINFPCSGKKSGIVDLGFRLNYTNMENGKSESLKIVVRRQCYKGVSQTTTTRLPSGLPSVSKVNKKTLTKNLIVGLVTSVLLVFIIIGGCGTYWCMQKRNRKLRMKFDRDYELKMKEREEELLKSSKLIGTKKDMLDLSENDELLSEDYDISSSKPIFIPKRSRDYHRKWKKHRRRRHNVENSSTSYNTNTLQHSTSFGRGLEQIPEEEVETVQSNSIISETDDESPIVENSHTIFNKNVPLHTLNKLNSKNASNSSSSVYDTSTYRTTNDKISASKNLKKPIKILNTFNNGSNNCHQSLNVNNSRDNHAYQESPNKKHLQHSHASNNVNTNTTFNPKYIPSVNIHFERLPLTSSQTLEELYSLLNKKWTSQFQNYLLSSQQIIMDNHPLGKGAFGQVYRGKAKGLLKDDPTYMTSVAIKVMIPSSDFDTISAFIAEALIMSRFKHQNVMNLLGIVLQTSQAPHIITPYMYYADLNQYLRTSRNNIRLQHLTSKQLINFGVQIACGMKYLADMGYVHRDLASRNCMVSKTLTIKISDFGLARDISKEHYRMNHKTRLPIKWMAIESLSDFIFSEKTDVWSFGVVLWELMTLGKQPYSGLDNQDMEDYLIKGKRLTQPPNCFDEIFHIMSSCWAEHADQRPAFTILYQQLVDVEEKLKNSQLSFTKPKLQLSV